MFDCNLVQKVLIRMVLYAVESESVSKKNYYTSIVGQIIHKYLAIVHNNLFEFDAKGQKGSAAEN